MVGSTIIPPFYKYYNNNNNNDGNEDQNENKTHFSNDQNYILRILNYWIAASLIWVAFMDLLIQHV